MATTSSRRVVVTGLGIVCPLGNDIPTSWDNILQSKSGIRLIDFFDTTDFSTKFAGTIQNFKPENYIAAKEVKKCDPFIQYGIAAGVQAIVDAGLDLNSHNINLERFGVMVGSGIGGIGSIENTSSILAKEGSRRVSPFFIPASLVNMISGHLSIMYGLKGPNLAVVTACATSTHAIGLSARMIKYGDADLMLTGGAEKACTPLGISGFNALRALSTRNDDPAGASKPWDKDRDGFVLGDGAGVLVLEEYEHAKKRGAKIYAELIGFGMSGDAYHITKPAPGAVGAKSAMRLALEDAKITGQDIGYINAHATSTPVGDVEESLAIQGLFGDYAKNIPISSTKSMTGHLLGAAGAVEAIFSILALRDQVIPATINLVNPDVSCNLDYVPGSSRQVKNLHISMSNSFGFGGTNGTLIFKNI
jgi:3-oxoacyl-[acyl-carrier-protein] synthase II